MIISVLHGCPALPSGELGSASLEVPDEAAHDRFYCRDTWFRKSLRAFSEEPDANEEKREVVEKLQARSAFDQRALRCHGRAAGACIILTVVTGFAGV
jgi:hypothetical protein